MASALTTSRPSGERTGSSGKPWAPPREAVATHASSRKKRRRCVGVSTALQDVARGTRNYNRGMEPTRHASAIFTLQQARALLPQVKHLTADAVRRAETLASQLHGLAEHDPEHASLSAALREVVNGWADQV